MPRRNFYQAVIFNFDSVLLDTERITCDAWKRAGAAKGYPLSEPIVRTLIGLPRNEAASFLRRIFGETFPFDAVHQCMVALNDAYFENWGISLKRGTTALLEILDDLNIRKAIVSEHCQKLLDKWTLQTGLFVHFPVTISADEASNGKTPFSTYGLAAERLDIDPERCLVIEHSDFGVRAAHAAGMTVILIPDLQQPSEEAITRAYRVEPSLEYLADELPPMMVSALTTDLQPANTTSTVQPH